MNITEKEAAGKWCPFARALPMHSRNPYQSAANRIVNSDGVAQILSECIGSRCMAWRETAEYRADTNQETVKGHCGLAGSP